MALIGLRPGVSLIALRFRRRVRLRLELPAVANRSQPRGPRVGEQFPVHVDQGSGPLAAGCGSASASVAPAFAGVVQVAARRATLLQDGPGLSSEHSDGSLG